MVENNFSSETLQRYLRLGQNMPHSYLFIGNETKNAVELFAADLTGQNFPNIDTILFDAKSAEGVEDLRRALQLAALMPVGGAWKVMVLAHMEEANLAMLNTLLKSLEEPSSRTVFVLSSTKHLIATVMSRCQVLYLPWKPSELREELFTSLELLKKHRGSGLTERMALVTELAELEDDLLPNLLEHWINVLKQDLSSRPQLFQAIRATMDALQGLRSNFNKKLVLQNFVTTGLK